MVYNLCLCNVFYMSLSRRWCQLNRVMALPLRILVRVYLRSKLCKYHTYWLKMSSLQIAYRYLGMLVNLKECYPHRRNCTDYHQSFSWTQGHKVHDIRPSLHMIDRRPISNLSLHCLLRILSGWTGMFSLLQHLDWSYQFSMRDMARTLQHMTHLRWTDHVLCTRGISQRNLTKHLHCPKKMSRRWMCRALFCHRMSIQLQQDSQYIAYWSPYSRNSRSCGT